jgi:2-dehydropantoate 2-reductase
MKIVVIGAGAVGSLVGGLLAHSGEDVTLIGRPAHVQQINAHGLQISGVCGDLNVPIKAVEKLDLVPDLVLLGVKTQDLLGAVEENRQWIEQIPIVAMQNGVQAEGLLASVLPKTSILGAAVFFGATFLEPGRVDYGPAGNFVIGEAFGPIQARTKAVATILNKAIPTAVTNNLQGVHWTKLIINENNALPAVTGMNMLAVNAHPYLRNLSVKLMKEALRIITAAGNSLASIPQMPAGFLRLLLNMPMPFAGLLPRLFSRTLGNSPALGSTLQSIKRGRSTEIDYLNGEIVSLGKRIGQSAPYNSTIVNMVHEVEERGMFYTPENVKSRIQAAT